MPASNPKTAIGVAGSRLQTGGQVLVCFCKQGPGPLFSRCSRRHAAVIFLKKFCDTRSLIWLDFNSDDKSGTYSPVHCWRTLTKYRTDKSRRKYRSQCICRRRRNIRNFHQPAAGGKSPVPGRICSTYDSHGKYRSLCSGYNPQLRPAAHSCDTF